MMNADTIAEQLLEGTGLSVIDLARLALETIEELGGRKRKNVLVRLRTVMRAGVQAIKDAERTVNFRKAAEQSIAERRDLRPTSLRDIRHYVRRFLKDAHFAARPLRAISVRECRELLQREFGHSPSSFVKARAILSSVFSFGMRQEWCDANPVSRITVPRVQETPIEPLTQEEISRLETTVEQPRFRDMKFSLHLLLYNGIRPTEVSRLRPEDIDKHARLIRIRSQVCKTGGGRILPLRGTIDEHDICIPRGWHHRWRELRREAGFSRWVPDVLRHTFASYHAAHFRNLPALQLEMGHRDLSLLRTRYISPVPPQEAAGFWRRYTSPAPLKNAHRSTACC